MRSPLPKHLGQVSFLLIVLVGSIASVSFSLQSFTAIPSNGSIYYPPEAEVLFQDEFESGDFNAWNGTYTTVDDKVTVVSISPYDGVYHGRFQTNAIVSGVKCAYCYEELSPAVSEVYARGYFHIVDGLPLDDNDDRFGLIGFEVNGELQSTFRIHRSGGVDRFNIVGLDGTSPVQKSTDAIYPAEGRWYCIEFYIKVHDTRGEYRVWINGVERIAITNLHITRYGTGVSRVHFGLTYTANVQHDIEVYCDSVVLSTRYVGQLRYTFGVIGSVEENPAVRNFYWLFGNQSISYRCLLPSEVTNFADVNRFDGLVVWTRHECGYNATAIKQFARTHVVISHVWDFCNVLHPSLSGSTQVVSTNTVTYVMDWGNFRTGDRVEMRNETGNIDQLTTVLASGLASFTNITAIARYDAERIALFHMNGMQSESGLYVMDLDATTPETEWAGIWHVFPAVKMVKDFPTGRYARWFANGIDWPDIDWVYSWMTDFTDANSDVVTMQNIGTSVQGRPINAFFIGDGTRYAIVDGSIHGNEKSTTFTCLRLAEVIVEDYHAGGYWSKRLQEYTVIIIPVLNPDGFDANTRENANGVDLNRQFPPGGMTTEPEAWALRWLMDSYTPTIYVNNHEGTYWYPLDIFYGVYEVDPYKSFTVDTIRWANISFTELRHWGYYTGHGLNVWIGKVRKILKGGITGMAVAYASWKYNASCMLCETFMWYPIYKARQGLWATDYYVCVALAFLSHLDKIDSENFIVYSTGKIESTTWTGRLNLEIDSGELTSASITKIYVCDRGKPLAVRIDGVEKTEGNGWTYSNEVITIIGTKRSIEIGWIGET